MKVCRKCKLNKPKSEFNALPSRTDGLRSYCKTCDNNFNKTKYATSEKERTRCHSKHLMKYWPGATPEQVQINYNQLLEQQYHCCKICKKHVSTFNRKLAVDHCHQTGVVRGLLCYRCNKYIVGAVNFNTATQLVKYLFDAYPLLQETIKDVINGKK